MTYPPARRSSTCAASWSRSARCRPAMSRWSGWNAGSPPPSPNATTPTSNNCCTATRSGICCAGSAAGSTARPPPTTKPSSCDSTSRPQSSLLEWLATHGLTLSSARQGDLEAWLAGGDAAHRREAGNFVRWAKQQKLTSLDFAATKWGGPTQVIDTEARWEQARWLLHDETIKPEDRVAGLLVLLYAQRPAAISRLTLDHVELSGPEVRLRLGREPVMLPEPLADLVREVVATRGGHAALGNRHVPMAVPRRLLAEKAGLQLSSASVSALFTERPSQIKLTTLIALCTARDCTPNDLLRGIDTAPVVQPISPTPTAVAVNDTPAGRGGAVRCRRSERDAADPGLSAVRPRGRQTRTRRVCTVPLGYARMRRSKSSVLNRPGFRAHFFLREGWHDAEQVRREHQGQGGPVGPRASRRLRHGVGGDSGDLGAAGDERGDAA